jgi:hypothetical protein
MTIKNYAKEAFLMESHIIPLLVGFLDNVVGELEFLEQVIMGKGLVLDKIKDGLIKSKGSPHLGF